MMVVGISGANEGCGRSICFTDSSKCQERLCFFDKDGSPGGTGCDNDSDLMQGLLCIALVGKRKWREFFCCIFLQ